MNRWRVQKINYRQGFIVPLPWLATSTRGDSILFATHTQALTYATRRIQETA